MQGTIINHKLCCKREVTVYPIKRHYEEPGETPYIKYGCPVCDAIGNTKISIAEGTKNCPLCSVKLEWERKPERYDLVTINDYGYQKRSNGFPKGETLTIKDIITKEDGTKVYLLTNKDGNERLYLEEEFSILLNPDEHEGDENHDK